MNLCTHFCIYSERNNVIQLIVIGIYVEQILQIYFKHLLCKKIRISFYFFSLEINCHKNILNKFGACKITMF